MAVSGITGNSSVLLPAPGSRVNGFLRRTSSQSVQSNSIQTAPGTLAAANTTPFNTWQTGQVPPNTALTLNSPAATGTITANFSPTLFGPATVPDFSSIQLSRDQISAILRRDGRVPQGNAVTQAAQAPIATQPVSTTSQDVITAIPTSNTLPLTATTATAPAVSQTVNLAQPEVLQFAVPLQNANVATTPTAVAPPGPVQVGTAAVEPQATIDSQAAVPAVPVTVPAPANPTANIVSPNPVQIALPLQNVVSAATPTAAQTTAAPAAAQAETVATPTPQPQEIIQQNELLINEILRSLGFAASATRTLPLFNTTSPFLTALIETQGLTPLQQSALLVNETLQDLNFIPIQPTNPLLINEIPASIEALGFPRELTQVERNALFINQTLREVGVNPLTGGQQQVLGLTQQTRTAATTAQEQGALALTVPQEENIAQTAAALPQVETPAVSLAEPGITTAAAGPATAAAAAPTTTTAAEVAIPVTAAFLSQELTFATLPLSLFPDRTPYVIVVYQVADPAPLPLNPEPFNREVGAVAPVAATRSIGNARYRQAQLRARESGQTNAFEYSLTPVTTLGQAEKSIRYTVGQVNADMAAQGQPLHFVFAKHDNGFALDVYDCSYTEACLLTYDVPLQLDNLAGILSNLQNETGVIVNRES